MYKEDLIEDYKKYNLSMEDIKLSIRLRGRVGVAKKICNNIEDFKFELLESKELKEGIMYKFSIAYEDVSGYIDILEKGCNQILAVKIELDHWGMSLTLEEDNSLYELADHILMDHDL